MKIKREYVLNLNVTLLEGKKVVYNPYIASKEYGGCTQVNGIYHSNYTKDGDLNISSLGNNEIRIYIPNDFNGEHIDNNTIQAIKHVVIDKIKGINSKASYKGEQLALGYWVMDSGELVEERIDQLVFENIHINKNTLKLITSIGDYLRIVFNQEAISIEINNQLLIV